MQQIDLLLVVMVRKEIFKILPIYLLPFVLIVKKLKKLSKMVYKLYFVFVLCSEEDFYFFSLFFEKLNKVIKYVRWYNEPVDWYAMTLCDKWAIHINVSTNSLW